MKIKFKIRPIDLLRLYNVFKIYRHIKRIVKRNYRMEINVAKAIYIQLLI